MPQLKLEELRNIQAETCKTFGNPKRLLIIETIWVLISLVGLARIYRERKIPSS